MSDKSNGHGRTGGAMRVPRSRGAVSGLLLVVLGVWGAIIPFIGPYASYAYTPDTTWTWTAARFWLEVLPGAVTVLGGLILLTTANRVTAVIGGWLAAAAGAWFVVGQVFAPLFSPTALGMPVGGTVARVVEQIGFFSGLGVVITFLAAQAVGRFTVRSVRDVKAAERHSGRSNDDYKDQSHDDHNHDDHNHDDHNHDDHNHDRDAAVYPVDREAVRTDGSVHREPTLERGRTD